MNPVTLVSEVGYKPRKTEKMMNQLDNSPDPGNETESLPIDVNTPQLDYTPVTSAMTVPKARMNVRPREYSGDGSWRQYQGQFERAAKLNGWTEDRLDYLWVSLTGEALAFVEGLPETQRSTYDQLCLALERRFGAERLAAVHKATLLGRRRQEGETMSALGQDVRRLVNCAYPEFPSTAKEEIAIERFLDAINCSETRLTIHQQHPKTLDEAIEHGLQFEAWRQADSQKHGKSRVRVVEEEVGFVPADDAQVRLLKELQSQVTELKKTVSEKKTMRCFNCGKLGHLTRDCRLQKKGGNDRTSSTSGQGGRRTVICFKCGQEGHIARGCAATAPENE